jgi:hypothetical protein
MSSSEARQRKLPGVQNSNLVMSAYDRVSSWLIALIILSGAIVAVMFLIWIGPRLRYRPKVYSVVMEEEGYGRGDHPAGFARDSKAPGDPSLPMLEEPAGEEMPELSEPVFDDALASVVASATTIGEVGDVAADALGGSETRGLGGTGGGEGGLGDNRPPGPLGDNPNVVPRYLRWRVRYETSSEAAYAKQLDSFKIELAAIGGKQEVDYAFNLSKARPDRRSGPSKEEKRLYMAWQDGTLQQYDRNLLQRAGIDVKGRVVLQFYPKEAENELAAVESKNAPGRSYKEFFRTTFGVRMQGDRGEFYVIEQRFRPAPP